MTIKDLGHHKKKELQKNQKLWSGVNEMVWNFRKGFCNISCCFADIKDNWSNMNSKNSLKGILYFAGILWTVWLISKSFETEEESFDADYEAYMEEMINDLVR